MAKKSQRKDLIFFIDVANLLLIGDEGPPGDVGNWLDDRKTRRLLAKTYREGWLLAAQRRGDTQPYPRARATRRTRVFPTIAFESRGRWFKFGSPTPLHEMEGPLLFYEFAHEVRAVLRCLVPQRWEAGTVRDGRWVWSNNVATAIPAVMKALTQPPAEGFTTYSDAVLEERLSDSPSRRGARELSIPARGRREISVADDGTMSLAGHDPFHDGFLPTLEGIKIDWIRCCPFCHSLFLAARTRNDGCPRHAEALNALTAQRREREGAYQLTRYRRAESKAKRHRRTRTRPGQHNETSRRSRHRGDL